MDRNDSGVEPNDSEFAALCASIRANLRKKGLWFPEDDDVGYTASFLAWIAGILAGEGDAKGNCVPADFSRFRNQGNRKLRENTIAGMIAFLPLLNTVPYKEVRELLSRAPMAILPYLPSRSRKAEKLFEKNDALFDYIVANAQLDLCIHGSLRKGLTRDIFMATHLWLGVTVDMGPKLDSEPH